MITKPTLLLDETKCKSNIRRMATRARRFDVALRPHFKTHQSLEIGDWFKAEGISKITVSSLTMARYFAQEWDDITVAFPVNILEIQTINDLAKKIRLNLLIESEASALFLAEHLKYDAHFYIKVNIGNARAGLLPGDQSTIDAILKVAQQSDRLHFLGFLGHAGQTYGCRSKDEILDTHQQAKGTLVALKNKYKTRYPHLIASYGDTPSCSIAEDFEGIDEIRPGNFVFYDLMQQQIGACDYEQIAVAMACPVVAVHPDREEVIIYGGGIHFSKDRMQENGKTIFGKVVQKTTDGWGTLLPDTYLKKISQEHGVVHVPETEIKQYQIGDILHVLPVHSCMTADLMCCYHTLDDQEISMINTK